MSLTDYYGDHACLRTIRDDPNATQVVRDEAQAKLESVKDNDDIFLARFQKSNGLEFPYGNPETRQELMEELQLQLRSPYPPMSDAACTAIKRYFPGETCTKE